MARVEVRRKKLPHPVRDGIRSYKVVCDDVVVGSLDMGQSLAFDPGSGSHTLRVKIDFLKSRAIKFDLAADGIASFECEPGGSYFMAIFDMIKSEGYVALRRIDQPA